MFRNTSFGLFRTDKILCLISLKKFQAKGINNTLSSSVYVPRISEPTISMDEPGVNRPCFNLLSSIIISSGILAKFKNVFPFAGAQ